MTSSALGDTALCYQLGQATDIIIEDVRKLGEICRRRACEERDTLCVGRTHGIHAEPMTFGMKFGSWAWELKRDHDRLVDARQNVAFYGMTSSDLGDTALCYQLVQATDIIIEDVRKLGEICRRRAIEERDTLCVGRTHGIHAEPMTFGMKFGSWAWELKRDLDRLVDARKNVAFGAISGAVGTYSSIDPFVEEYVCEHLGLVHDPLSSPVISLDHHAYLAGVLATTAATCDRIATEIRSLPTTDTLEVEEPFRKGQTGSSAEPVAQADSFMALDHMLTCLIRIVDGLILYPARMKANLDLTRGLIYSSKVLLALVDTGISREDAYKIVQRNSMAVWDDVHAAVDGLDLRSRLEADPETSRAA